MPFVSHLCRAFSIPAGSALTLDLTNATSIQIQYSVSNMHLQLLVQCVGAASDRDGKWDHYHRRHRCGGQRRCQQRRGEKQPQPRYPRGRLPRRSEKVLKLVLLPRVVTLFGEVYRRTKPIGKRFRYKLQRLVAMADSEQFAGTQVLTTSSDHPRTAERLGDNP